MRTVIQLDSTRPPFILSDGIIYLFYVIYVSTDSRIDFFGDVGTSGVAPSPAVFIFNTYVYMSGTGNLLI